MEHTKTSLTITIMAAIIFCLTIINTAEKAEALKTTCASFKSQREAQKKYNSYPTRYTHLDGNVENGVVCEDYQYNNKTDVQ